MTASRSFVDPEGRTFETLPDRVRVDLDADYADVIDLVLSFEPSQPAAFDRGKLTVEDLHTETRIRKVRIALRRRGESRGMPGVR